MKTDGMQGSGLYISECCLKEVPFLKRQMFSRCPRCSALTVWEFVEQKELAQRLPADPILNREDARNLFPKEFLELRTSLA